MATTTSNSQNVTLTANTESHLTWAEWFDWLEIQVIGSGTVWIATDGSTVTSAETGADVCIANSTIVVPNRQARPAWFTPGQDMSLSTGATPQQSQNGSNLPASGHGTYVSLISSGTPQVVVTPY